MNATAPGKSRILAVGPAVAALARQAFPEASVEALDPNAAGASLIARDLFDLVLVETAAGEAGALARLVEGLAGWSRPPAAILVGAHLPAALAKALFRLARSDALDWPLAPADLALAAQSLLAPAQPAAPVHTSRCWSVLGAVGGAGGTTLTIELASSLSGRGRVGLFDLNLADGATSAYLGVPANMRLVEASDAPERIDPAVLEAFALPTGFGFDLFAAPRDAYACAKVSPLAVCRLLEVACEVYDWLLIDLPRARQGWTRDVLAGSDEVLVISELTVPALLAARDLAGEIEQETGGGRAPRIVLNRMSSRVFGPAPSRAEAEKALGRRVDGAITSDWEAAACSVNLGGPISQHRPRSKIVRDVQSLVEALAPANLAAPVAARGRR